MKLQGTISTTPTRPPSSMVQLSRSYASSSSCLQSLFQPMSLNHNGRRRALRYLRVSTDDQARGYSLSDQAALIERWCQTRGVEIVATYSDDESARTRT